jgi:hypothetical protein
MVYPLFTRRFWYGRRNHTTSSYPNEYSGTGISNRHRQITGEEIELGGRFTVTGRSGKRNYGLYSTTAEMDRSESREGITRPDQNEDRPWVQDGILVQRDVVVERSHR